MTQYDYIRALGAIETPVIATPLQSNGAMFTSATWPAGTTVKYVQWNLNTGVEVTNVLASVIDRVDGGKAFQHNQLAGDVAAAGVYGVRWAITYADGSPDQWPLQDQNGNGAHQVLLVQSPTA